MDLPSSKYPAKVSGDRKLIYLRVPVIQSDLSKNAGRTITPAPTYRCHNIYTVPVINGFTARKRGYAVSPH
jgi:hypothetical protein